VRQPESPGTKANRATVTTSDTHVLRRDWRMTQQSETDGRGDDAAQNVATRDAHKCKQDPAGGGNVGSRRAIGIDALPKQRSSLQPKGTAPLQMRTDLARFESAFPTFSFIICTGRDGPRFEEWRDTTPSGLYAIITDDPDELLHELNMAVR
jgi:hypothetical protein